ncbi:DNA translocase FtsK [Bacillus sp. S/N-304-OC-R1]|uniref:DNA translocase FtsK n=1 Tax=Bacillus sp. S/N-304-OC-R1 TaxID=2758034 RepID=UPI001C8DA3AB|nr:DNA translocase FtsK [Bacillus sp. S/N-304-OC-R1]MBY0124135.1 DNA translocase FtsK [Bacillus sp. S/N-304-OC-R1]
MSWIKKLFQKIKNDDNNEYDEEYLIEERRNPTEIQNHSEPSKDINARVLYQYPKGNFRFPLIPDEESNHKTREPRVDRESKKQVPRYQETRAKRSAPVEKEPKAAQIKVKAEKERTQRKGPFRPTEIPSPIYGFGRPKKEEPLKKFESEPIEFELNNIIQEDQISEAKQIQNLTPFNEYIAEQVQEEDHPVFLDHPEPSYMIEEETDLEEEYTEANTEQYEVIDDAQLQTVPYSDPVDLLLKDEVFNGEEQFFDVEVSSEEETLISVDQTEIEEETEDKATTISADPEEEETVAEAAPARKHIPFNVIMLKNDKQRLSEKTKIPFMPSFAEKAEVRMETDKASEFHEIAPIIEEVKPSVDRIASAIEETIGAAEKKAPVIEDFLTEEDDISYYQFPSKSLLLPPVNREEPSDWFIEQEQLLNSTLINFNVRAHVVNVTQGPSVTRFEVQPEPGVKVNKITNLSDDIKLSLAARDIRIEAPIPGKHTIGIEVPNKTSRPVLISEIINSSEFNNSQSPLTAVLGLDIAGKPIVTDLRKMPHGLIAGATGSGKSVCINTILVSLLYKATPEELKLILIDPKMVELAPYNRIPHLVSPVITDVKAATAALKWAVEEMERRYELFAHTGVRDIGRFNELAEEHKRYSDKLPYMVIIIDELADLMMMSPADVEEAICRIAQKARACGIHLIIATQRPSVDVITGLIKANVPTRIAFSVSSQIDSRTIIDISGAEKLLGRGDMLFLENGSSKPVRLQGTYVSDQEIDDVVAHVRREREPEYLFEQEELLKKAQVIEEEDELFYEACEFVIDQGAASTSSLQRRFKIGYNRAARLIDMMEKQGFISETRGSKPREVLITAAELESLLDTSTIN